MKTIDPRKILRGYDGRLFHEGDFLAEVNEFDAQVTVNNTGYQPAGSKLEMGVTTGYSVGLTFTETVIRDAILLKKLLDHLKGDTDDVSFDFVGMLHGHDGSQGEYAFRSCEPDGTLSITGAVTPGSIIQRPWSFRVNEPPDLLGLLGDAA